MSSNIRIKRVCEQCRKSFIAKTTVTKFCSKECNSRHYKAKAKEAKITAAILKVNAQTGPGVDRQAVALGEARGDSSTKEWITVPEIADTIGVSVRTLFRVVKQPGFPKIKIGRRLVLNRMAVLEYFSVKEGEVL